LAKEFQALSKPEHDLYMAEQYAALRKKYGSDEAVEDMLKATGVALKVAAASPPNNPFFKAIALRPVIARDLWIIGTVANLGKRYGGWADGRPTKL
jgi:hypothetical protein